MVVVRIWGGIGNQLFQFIFGEYIKYKYGVQVVYDEGSFLSVDKQRKKEIDFLNKEIAFTNNFKFGQHAGIKHRILRLLYQLNPRNHFLTEDNLNSIDFKESHTYYFQGYWQDAKYFNWLKETIGYSIEEKVLPSELFDVDEKIRCTKNSIAVHIRRGDYFSAENINVYGVCDQNYFQNAISLIENHLEDATYFVFSDDLDWVRNNLCFPHNVYFVPNYDVSQFSYIRLMALCQHQIISNSTFSWWAAMLNSNTEKIVIAPSKWKKNTDRTIVLDQWIKI